MTSIISTVKGIIRVMWTNFRLSTAWMVIGLAIIGGIALAVGRVLAKSEGVGFVGTVASIAGEIWRQASQSIQVESTKKSLLVADHVDSRPLTT